MPTKHQWSARFEGSHVYLRTPFESDFVEDLKQAVPPRGRFWDNWHREWRVDEDYWDEVEELLEDRWGAGTVLDTMPRKMLVRR